jgi:hypothetical protein
MRVGLSNGMIIIAVWFSVFIAALLGLLGFAGEAAMGAVFSVRPLFTALVDQLLNRS